MNKTTVLVSLSSTGKIRVVDISYEWNEESSSYTIYRYTGQYQGKMTHQPDIIISEGKAKRSVDDQVELEYNSHIKKYCDKGYKILDKDIDDYTESELHEIVGENKTDSSGLMKPMNAKQADKVANKKVFDKIYLGSRKIDGLKCLIYKGEDGELHASSRGSSTYDGALYTILHNDILIQIFNENPGLIMDGEVYKYGLSLQQINSLARTQKIADDMYVLEYYWYDIVDTEAPFSERNARMESLAKKYNIGWNPNRKFKDEELRVQLVPQILISGWDNMEKLHDQYVAEEWEGLVIKLVTGKYGPGKRTNDCIKIKRYTDEEFKITGYELGLRGNEDMCFICETKEGIPFKAKPWGDREQKDWYVENFDKECLNHMAVVKYFYMSDENVPLQPSVKCIRLKGDL